MASERIALTVPGPHGDPLEAPTDLGQLTLF